MDADMTARAQIDALRVRIEQLERQVARLNDHAGIAEAPRPAAGASLEDEIVALLQQNNAIEAIVRYRDRTGSDLASAKSAVDRIRVARLG